VAVLQGRDGAETRSGAHIDAFRDLRLEDGPLGPRQINKQLRILHGCFRGRDNQGLRIAKEPRWPASSGKRTGLRDVSTFCDGGPEVMALGRAGPRGEKRDRALYVNGPPSRDCRQGRKLRAARMAGTWELGQAADPPFAANYVKGEFSLPKRAARYASRADHG